MKGLKGEIWAIILLFLLSVSYGEAADTIVVRAGKADHFLVAAPSQAMAGESFRVRIEARDVHNNLVSNYDKEGGDVNIIADGAGIIKPEIIKAISFKGGITQVEFTYTLAEPITVTVKDDTARRSGTSRRIMVRPGSLHRFIITTPPKAVAGELFLLKIEARDAHNNTIVDYNRIGKGVKISTNSPGIINPRRVALSSFQRGVALVNGIFNKTGIVSLKVEEQEGKGYGISNDMVVAPGKIDHFIVTTPSSGTAGEPFKVKIEARDAYDNLIDDYSRRGRGVTITTNGAGTIKPEIVLPSSFREGTAEIFFSYDKAESFSIVAAERPEAPLPGESGEKIPQVDTASGRNMLLKAEKIIRERTKREAQILFRRAVKDVDRNKYPEAKNALEKALKLDPGNSESVELLERLKSVMEILEEK